MFNFIVQTKRAEHTRVKVVFTQKDVSYALGYLVFQEHEWEKFSELFGELEGANILDFDGCEE